IQKNAHARAALDGRVKPGHGEENGDSSLDLMHIHLPALSGLVLTYLLVFARVGAMIMLLPGLGTMGVPSRVRLVLALAVAYALTPVVQAQYPAAAPASAIALGILIAQEITAGVLVGAMAAIIMNGLQVGGFLIASQIGLAYSQSFDPSQNTQGVSVSTFLALLGTVAIFATNLHHLAQLVIQLVSSTFALGFQLAAPFLVFGFAVYAGLGLLARLMHQIQVFF